MSNRQSANIKPLTTIETVAQRWADMGSALGRTTSPYPTTLTEAITNQQNAARDFVLFNEATTATEAALQANVLFAELDILDNSTPLDDDEHEEVMARLAFAAESIARFLIGIAGERYQQVAGSRSDLQCPSYRIQKDASE